MKVLFCIVFMFFIVSCATKEYDTINPFNPNGGSTLVRGDASKINEFSSFYEKLAKIKKSVTMYRYTYAGNKNYSYLYDFNGLDISNGLSIKSMNTEFKLPKIEDKFSIGKDTIAQLLGKNIIFSSNQGSTESIYFSQGLSNIRMSSDSALNKSKGFTIYWQPDNTVADKTVMIELYYDAIFEKSLIIGESKLPEKSKSILIFANDVGSYTVNSDDLNYFPSPLNAFQISIHRGNYKVLNLNNSEIPVMIFDKHTLYQRLE